jgi:TRAP-type C4-dicarboxylate transport system substrate-binding protein
MRRFLIACAAIALGGVSAVKADPVKLKFAFFTGETERTWTTTIKPFIDAINQEGKGIVEIDAYPNGALGRNMAQQAQMVLDGVADIAFVLPALTPGRFTENQVMELPGIVTDVKDATLIYSGMLRGGKIKGFEDFYVIAALGGDSFPLHTRQAIGGLADLKGKKIRAGGALQSRTLKALGIVPVLMPINEVPEAIARGTIDGTAIQTLPMIDYGVGKVVSFHYFAGIGFTPLAVLMNKKKFDSLPPKAKAIVEKYSGDWMNNIYNKGFGEASKEAIAQLAADPKRKVIYPTEAERRILDETYKSVVEEWTAQSPRNAELYKELLAVTKQVRSQN